MEFSDQTVHTLHRGGNQPVLKDSVEQLHRLRTFIVVIRLKRSAELVQSPLDIGVMMRMRRRRDGWHIRVDNQLLRSLIEQRPFTIKYIRLTSAQVTFQCAAADALILRGSYISIADMLPPFRLIFS
ncbi:hypothetical protein CO057_00910 [Candidatus Uhrbacteria bacterium CG_4_9_14_0_2_um_filter_41_50]|uniref:Uncharacterized protein n=1 Tax=Candidatus Uhrbacteria bacterium CG_4_9_14_0_2_um_filter_41_50 TaxID=1975031 RepID=A0A2M8EQ22_9BACT|nr:MAG: hypothetical protein COZ45_03120 [Candidatus Uhrbacteria bacterium CG_4_10_14_3_um_filter_41_21]PIZ54627.1 MAG: hypothetical protein COY24_03020 [Candidatus Uhrbacteria bacterium CG_4_10_14_0_2_um_filter_41_21]PJC24777.1 MAG: hypothetical protein CO057_00910 [Candidatus Uhrbacteria bacterium CG_4_9_14_0_2_um_filter_41_50]PJE75120.1 MAG: hypothetical protein COV03_01690 [Candidatus Uhrbacteria bacterium CG10_big_fil_rev_8_21_14_0_10_41_26]